MVAASPSIQRKTHIATMKNDLQMMHMLVIELGAEMERHLRPCLHVAAYYDQHEAARVLVRELGAATLMPRIKVVVRPSIQQRFMAVFR